MQNISKILTGEDAARLVIRNALSAASRNTFGVGGFMATRDGRVLATAVNHVISNNLVVDPTAHVERQLLDWYWTQRTITPRLPSPADVVIYSSLDPCLMCAGAALASHIPVTSLALDDYAGISGIQPGQFLPLMAPKLNALHDRAAALFSYFGVENERPFIGKNDILAGNCLAAYHHKSASDIFYGSADKVRLTIKNEHSVGYDVKTASLSVRARLNDALGPYALQKAEANLAAALVQTAKRAKNSMSRYEAAALVDGHGTILMVRGDMTGVSPIHTAMIKLISDYSHIRASLPAPLSVYLPHFRECTIVSLNGPDMGSGSALSLMELGAFGACMEGPLPEGRSPAWLYVMPHASQSEIGHWMTSLPALYRDVVKVHPMPAPASLQKDIRGPLPSDPRGALFKRSVRNTFRPVQTLYPGVTPVA